MNTFTSKLNEQAGCAVIGFYPEDNSISFTTDTEYWTYDGDFELIFDLLQAQFQTSHFNVNVHEYDAQMHDKTISILFNPELPGFNYEATVREAIEYLEETFYTFGDSTYLS